MADFDTIDACELGNVTGGGANPSRLAGIAERVWKWLGPGAVRRDTPRGAPQYMSPDGERKIRFDLEPSQHKGTGPHINLEQGRRNEHIFLGD